MDLDLEIKQLTFNENKKQVADINIEDLLGRVPIILDKTEIGDYLSNQVVLVTGAGGSIGSELCRQIITYKPKQLIMFDIYMKIAYMTYSMN